MKGLLVTEFLTLILLSLAHTVYMIYVYVYYVNTGDYTNRILNKHTFIFYRIGPWRPCAMCIYPLRGKGKFRHFQWLSCACSWPRILSNIFLYFTIIAGLGIRSSVFSSESFVFVWSKEQNSDSLLEKSTSLPSLFFKERPERIAHSHSFIKSDGSDSLTVALF